MLSGEQQEREGGSAARWMGAHTSAGCVVLEISHDDGLEIVCKARGKRKVGGKKGKKEKKWKKEKKPTCALWLPPKTTV